MKECKRHRFIYLLRIFLFPVLCAASPVCAQHLRLYACTLASNNPADFMGGSSLGAGLWQSDDTGRTWTQRGWKHVKCYSMDAADNGKTIFMGCGSGVLRSTDGGENWQMMTDWRIREVLDVAIDPVSPKIVYIATAQAIWKSDDAGENWYEADTDIPAPVFASRIMIDPSHHQELYVATETGLFHSTNSAATWKKFGSINGAVRDMLLGAKGPESVITEPGEFSYFESGRWLHRAEGNNFWTVCRDGETAMIGGRPGVVDPVYGSAAIENSPKNVHALISAAGKLVIGSLDGAVWIYDSQKKSCEPIGLKDLQVWRIKPYIIK